MRFKKLTMIACAALLCAAATAFAQTSTPPPSPDPAVVDQVYKMIDKNGDGVLQKEEVLAWVKQAYPPGPNGEPAGMMLMQPGAPPPPPPPPPSAMVMMPPPPGPLPTPPPCTTALFTSELTPQKTGVPCNGKDGNLIFRTVCNADSFDVQAIVLPAGRAAGCFGIEAITGGRIAFGIRDAGGRLLYHTSSGPIPPTLVLWPGTYQIFLDRPASDPGARVTVRFVDYAP